MKRYVIEFSGCVEVEADSKWEAFEKAWRQVDCGEFEFDEPQVMAIEPLPGRGKGRPKGSGNARAIAVTPQMRARAAVAPYAIGGK